MTLQVYNSLTRQKEEFNPIEPGFVGIYVCGPTVYGHAHIGHGKSYVSFDVIVRYLCYLGYKVRYVQNITDVGHLTDDADAGEDKIIKQAKKERLEPMEIVETYTRSYFEDMDALNNLRPDISPRASAHIPEQIALIEELLETEHAYESNGSVYFDVSSFSDYGKLSGRKVEELAEGVRISVRSEKRHPADFALWKNAESGHLMQWPSPWGEGYPGWHVECSVMSTKYLGQPFDIHGGGLENIFPHHESEIAQSEASHDQTFANYWLHNNMVTVNGMKMGKSLGNAINLKEAFQGTHPLLSKPYNPLTIRFFILSSHYRSPLDFSDEALQAAEKGLARLHATVKLVRDQLRQASPGDVPEAVTELINRHKQAFEEAMNDDFNTAQAIATLFEFTKEVNTLLNTKRAFSQDTLAAINNLYQILGEDVLGLIPHTFTTEAGDDLINGLLNVLIQIRQEARSKKDWATADAIRDKLAELDIILEDRPDGTIWKLSQ
ncbi:MAG: cysteine--tRNA ligase [Phycisphaerae bacterium]|nr:cysteine--tRNA ligase [Phycisphaerae bacterium]NIW92241.1 cysteine--tRNA ligase [Phycisphaerae bacterium]NIX27251.1 cysteine--tRNA ligase [Phycisphaerae bacterium]